MYSQCFTYVFSYTIGLGHETKLVRQINLEWVTADFKILMLSYWNILNCNFILPEQSSRYIFIWYISCCIVKIDASKTHTFQNWCLWAVDSMPFLKFVFHYKCCVWLYFCSFGLFLSQIRDWDYCIERRGVFGCFCVCFLFYNLPFLSFL